MKDWQPLLQQADAIVPLTGEESESIRRAMLAEVASRVTSPRHRGSRAGTAIGCMLALAVAAGVFAARARAPEVSAVPPATTHSTLRHLQFATPGGTRIIWQFNPQFTMQGTNP